MPSVEKINVQVLELKSFLESEQSVLKAMGRRHDEYLKNRSEELTSELQNAYREYDHALRELIRLSKKVCTVLDESIRRIE